MKKWKQVLAVTTAFSMAACPAVMAEDVVETEVSAASELPQEEMKTMLGEAFSKLFAMDANSEWETFFGMSQMQEALKNTASEVTLKADITSSDLEENVAFDVSLASDPVNEAYGVGMNFNFADIGIEAKVYADEEKIQAQVPSVAEDVLLFPYREGAPDVIPEGNPFAGMDKEIDMACGIIADCWDMLSFDVEGTVERFVEQSDAYEALVEGITVTAADQETLWIDDEECLCDGYMVTIDGQKANDLIADILEFMRDDAEVLETIMPWIEFGLTAEEGAPVMTDETLEEDGEPAAEAETKSAEEFWKESVDEILTDWVEIREAFPTEIPVYIYMYDSQIAEIWGFLGDNHEVYYSFTLTGGKYRAQNYRLYVAVEEDDEEECFSLEKYADYDENGGNVGYMMMSNDGTTEDGEIVQIDFYYDAESGEFNICTGVGEEENEEEVTLDGKVTALEKGKSIALELYNLDGHVNEEAGVATLGYEIRTDIGEVAALEGPELNLFTATQYDYTNYIVKFMELADQITAATQPEIAETESAIVE